MTTLHVVLSIEKRDLPNSIAAGILQALLNGSDGANLQTITVDESAPTTDANGATTLAFDFPGVADDAGALTIVVQRLDSNGTAIENGALTQPYTVTPTGTQPTGAQFDAPASLVVTQV